MSRPFGVAVIVAALACACSREGPDASAGRSPPESSSRRASSFHSERLARRLDVAAARLQARGWQPLGSALRGFLAEGASSVHEVQAARGRCLVLLAVFSSGLRGADVRLVDVDGIELGRQPRGEGDGAALHVCPTGGGTLWSVLRSSDGSGLYELRAFEGPSGTAAASFEDLFERGEPREREPTEGG
ncbi:MAG: hypothetical protein NZ898_11980 [Myxococcota bacterium]|nr:hypothetical protein [Myxococcota bacterium]MDW8360914.1 hypothetical protein [Myxococcales bacterium]